MQKQFSHDDLDSEVSMSNVRLYPKQVILYILAAIGFVVCLSVFTKSPDTENSDQETKITDTNEPLMFEFTSSDVSSSHQNATKFKIHESSDPNSRKQITFQQFLKKLNSSKTFRNQFKTTITSVYPSYPFVFFESPPVNADSIKTKMYEFVLVSTGTFHHVGTDYGAFRDKFDSERCKNNGLNACEFPNLGNDAIMVTPKGVEGETHREKYTNLMSFLREGDEEEIDGFLKLVGVSAEKRVDEMGSLDTWISTSGLGISWLHLRLDSRPKYYTYRDYKKQ